MIKKFFSVGFASGILSLVRMIGGLLVTKFVAVHAGPSGLVIVGQLQNFLSIANGLVSAPAGNGLVRFTSQYGKDESIDACVPWWKASINLSFLIVILCCVLGILFGRFLADKIFGSESYTYTIYVTCALLPFACYTSVVLSVLNGYQSYRKYFLVGIISSVCSTAFVLVLANLYELSGAITGVLFGSLISAVVAWICTRNLTWFKARYWFGRSGHSEYKGIANYIAMAMVTSLTIPVAQLIVRRVIMENEGEAVSGYWQAVTKLSQSYMAVIILSVSTYLLPRLAKATCAKDIKKEIAVLLRIILPCMVVFGCLISLFKEPLMILLFSREFAPAVQLVEWQFMGDILKITAWLLAYPMISRGATSWFISMEIIYSCVYVLGVYLLVPAFDLVGAIYAYIMSYMIYLIILGFGFKHYAK
jgi:O-antigen/teichoic acid export membrane protein